MNRSRAISTVLLIAFLLLAFSVASSGAFFPPGAWYQQLTKPAWNPPAWVFGPVWSVLYASIAVSGWLVWRQRGFRAIPWTWAIYLTQLLFNGLWSWLFFGMQKPALALVDLIALWVGIVATILAFWRVRRLAGCLLIPYLLWVTFAGVLNFALWRLNL